MFRKISERIWYMEAEYYSDRPVLGYIRGDDFAFAVDAGASEAHVAQFYRELECNGLPLPAFTGISHYHWDHSYGAAFVHGVTLASAPCQRMLEKESAFEWTPEAMERRVASGDDISFGYHSKRKEYPDLSDIAVVPADIALHGNATVDLGGVHVEIVFCGGPHSDDHLIFFIPEERFLFLSDATGKELFTLPWEYDAKHPERLEDTIAGLPYNQRKLAPFIDLLDTLAFDRYLLGHRNDVLTKDELMSDLRSNLKSR
ncbi:MAG: MBL fold metallo-hydrolase [Clostridia bacterium]|nr:MBL fold metallo-hydrolase [Clostridia bacterium]